MHSKSIARHPLMLMLGVLLVVCTVDACRPIKGRGSYPDFGQSLAKNPFLWNLKKLASAASKELEDGVKEIVETMNGEIKTAVGTFNTFIKNTAAPNNADIVRPASEMLAAVTTATAKAVTDFTALEARVKEMLESPTLEPRPAAF